MGAAAKGAGTGVSALSAYNQYLAGKTQSGELKTQARQIELGVTQREADRKERLAKALATMTARGGASGVTIDGSVAGVMGQEIAESERATERDAYMSKMQAMTTRARARNVRKGASTSSLLDFATDQAGIYGG